MNDHLHKGGASGAARRRSRDRDSTERLLVEAALATFAEKGYEGTTTRLIAQKAGVSESLIQRYFNGKAGILTAVLRQGPRDLCDSIFGGVPLFETLEEEARWVMTRFVDELGHRSEYVRIVLGRVLLDPAFHDEYRRIPIRKQVKDEAEARLARYVQAGAADPATNVPMAAEMLVGLCFEVGFVHPQILRTDPDTQASLVDGLASLFARAIGSHSPVAPVEPKDPL